MAKTNGKGNGSFAPAPAQTKIEYNDAVKEAKCIIAASDKNQWRLAELAHLVDPKYGDKTLARFAKDIEVSPCTLERARSVWRKWRVEIPEPAPELPTFAVAMALQGRTDRADIVRLHPNLTRHEARQYKPNDPDFLASRPSRSSQVPNDADPRPAEAKADTKTVSKRQGELIVAANKATSAAREISQWLADQRDVTDAMEGAFREFVEEATGMLEAWKVRRGLPQGEQPDAPSSEVPALPVKPESVH